jgi:hypothetical protein
VSTYNIEVRAGCLIRGLGVGGILTFPHSQSRLRRAILRQSNHLQVIIDKRYDYAIMGSLHGHGSLLPSRLCSPAKRSF